MSLKPVQSDSYVSRTIRYILSLAAETSVNKQINKQTGGTLNTKSSAKNPFKISFLDETSQLNFGNFHKKNDATLSNENMSK